METTQNNTTLKCWQYNDLSVYYESRVDGGGRVLAKPTVEFFRKNYPGRTFETLFEWGCGPAFIGFALLAEGICNYLCLGDIEPQAIECVKRTVAENHLEQRVRYYVSDNFEAIPASERFDCVVSNFPTYFALNAKHPLYDSFKDDIRPNDPGWRIHEKFYTNVKPYLHPQGLLCLSEVEPYKCKVYVRPYFTMPYDIREEPPIDTFKGMMQRGGLQYLNAEPYLALDGVKFYMVMSYASA